MAVTLSTIKRLFLRQKQCGVALWLGRPAMLVKANFRGRWIRMSHVLGLFYASECSYGYCRLESGLDDLSSNPFA